MMATCLFYIEYCTQGEVNRGKATANSHESRVADGSETSRNWQIRMVNGACIRKTCPVLANVDRLRQRLPDLSYHCSCTAYQAVLVPCARNRLFRLRCIARPAICLQPRLSHLSTPYLAVSPIVPNSLTVGELHPPQKHLLSTSPITLPSFFSISPSAFHQLPNILPSQGRGCIHPIPLLPGKPFIVTCKSTLIFALALLFGAASC